MSFLFHYLTKKLIARKHRKPIKRRRKSLESAPQNPHNQYIQQAEREKQRQQQEQVSACPFHILDLPSHILIDILSRLPVKSILICRCVCETWRSLIADPHFTTLRLDRADVEIFLRTDSANGFSRTLHLVDLESLLASVPPFDLFDERETKVNMRFALPKHNGKYKKHGFGKREYCVVNSCNGFICLRKNPAKSPCIICNPITGEFVTIPKPEKDQSIRSTIVSGFGCSSCSKEYKVVRLAFRDSAANHPTGRVAEVYTLGTASWRTAGCFPKGTTQGWSATYFNGAIHWLCDDEGPDFIMAFDFEDEHFSMISPPLHFGQEQKVFSRLYQMSMGVLGGCLFVCDNTFLAHFDIWVMKDYGVQDSWTKLFSIDFLRYGHCKPIKQLENGDLVLIYDEYWLVLYKPEEKHFRIFRIREAEVVVFELIAYFPSFTSLKHAANGDNLKVQNVKSRWDESELWEEAESLSLAEESKLGMEALLTFW